MTRAAAKGRMGFPWRDRVQVGPVLVAMTGVVRPAPRKDIAIAISPAEDLWPAFCDRHQVEDVILNFAINVRDAIKLYLPRAAEEAGRPRGRPGTGRSR